MTEKLEPIADTFKKCLSWGKNDSQDHSNRCPLVLSLRKLRHREFDLFKVLQLVVLRRCDLNPHLLHPESISITMSHDIAIQN